MQIHCEFSGFFDILFTTKFTAIIIIIHRNHKWIDLATHRHGITSYLRIIKKTVQLNPKMEYKLVNNENSMPTKRIHTVN